MIIKRKYPELEQREFGIMSSDLYSHGGKKTYKKYIGRLRRSIGNKLAQMGRDSEARRLKAENNLEKLRKLTKENENLANSLVESSKNKGIEIIPDNEFSKAIGKPRGNNTYILGKEEKEFLEDMSKNSSDSWRRDIANKTKDKKAVVNLEEKSVSKDIPFTSHEIGHVENERNPIKRLVARLAGDSKKGTLKKRIFEPINERNAWINGIKKLKQSGATKEEIENTKKVAKEAIETYKAGENKEITDRLMNSIQIPSLIEKNKYKNKRYINMTRPSKHSEEKELMELFGDNTRSHTERQVYNLRRKRFKKKNKSSKE